MLVALAALLPGAASARMLDLVGTPKSGSQLLIGDDLLAPPQLSQGWHIGCELFSGELTYRVVHQGLYHEETTDNV